MFSARSLVLVAALVGSPALAQAEPRIPGLAHLLTPTQTQSTKQAVEIQRVAGELLLSELRCGACHSFASAKATAILPAPPLSALARQLAPGYVREFLANPAAARPGTTMPHVLTQLPSAERAGAAEDLTHYLFSLAPAAEPEPEWGDLQLRDDGRALYASLGCVACHGPQDADAEKSNAFVSLAHLPNKMNLAAVKQFLADPQTARPHTRMPNFRLGEDQQRALAMYLLRQRLPSTQRPLRELHQPGVRYEYYEGDVREGAPDWPQMKFVRRSKIDRFELPEDIRATKLAIRYTALLDVPAEGAYSFFTDSNDGSEVWIDRRLVLTNHGFHDATQAHGTVKLTPGLHAIEVPYWQDGGKKSLRVQWQGPGIPKATIPASVLFLPGSVPMKAISGATLAPDPIKVERGNRLLSQLRCQSCHEPGKPSVALSPLASARVQSGCLSGSVPVGAPDYGLSAEQRALLAAAIQLPPIKTPQAQSLMRLASHNCLACHERSGVGGPTAELNALFTQSVEVDLGEEGRLPPSLTGVGAKLRPEAALRIVARGELHVRPYMATRMPSFPLSDAADITQLLARADDGQFARPPAGNPAAFENGRRLLGTSSDMARTGFGCINCHNVAGRPATGSPGPDLELAPVRLTFAWFDRWLAHPQSIRPHTRMPAFWGAERLFPKVAGGSAKRQRAAIWAYLSRGATPLPEGMVATAKQAELVVGKEPLVFRTYMKDASPRAIVVGNPELVHVAFDANVVRMAKAWRGRFWDPSGTWTGRSGDFNQPLGDHVFDMPPGPSFATLESSEAAWPVPVRDTRDMGGRFLGYRLDAQRRPVFRYMLGETEISEVARPKSTKAGFSLVRGFAVAKPKANLFLQAASGKRIDKRSEEHYVVEDRFDVRLSQNIQKHAFVRTQGERQQLLIRVPQSASSFEVELRW